MDQGSRRSLLFKNSHTVDKERSWYCLYNNYEIYTVVRRIVGTLHNKGKVSIPFTLCLSDSLKAPSPSLQVDNVTGVRR